jgi:hypothetical protein
MSQGEELTCLHPGSFHSVLEIPPRECEMRNEASINVDGLDLSELNNRLVSLQELLTKCAECMRVRLLPSYVWIQAGTGVLVLQRYGGRLRRL